MKSYVEINKETGIKCLTVFYDRKLDDFDQAIEKGLKDHGLRCGQVNVIAISDRRVLERAYVNLHLRRM